MPRNKIHMSICRINKVKPGYVYYLKLKVLPAFGMRAFLEHVPHNEGANLIASYKLTLFK